MKTSECKRSRRILRSKLRMPKSDAWLGLWRSLKLTTTIRKITKRLGKKNDVASARRKKNNSATSTATNTTPKILSLTMTMAMRTLSGLIT